MIQIVTGALGAGKTLYSFTLMFDDFCRGHTVVTNIDLVWHEVKRLAARLRGVELLDSQYVRLDPEEARNWHTVIPWGSDGCTVKVYLDEIHLFYNARDWAKTGTENKGLLSFLSQSRKARVDVTFIAQEKENVEKQFRVLAQWELAIVSSEHVPLGFLMDLLNFFWKCFIVRKRDMQTGTKMQRLWRSYDPRFFKCYKSYSFLDKEMGGLAKEVARVDRAKLRRVSYFKRLGMNLGEPFRPLRAWLSRRKGVPRG